MTQVKLNHVKALRPAAGGKRTEVDTDRSGTLWFTPEAATAHIAERLESAKKNEEWRVIEYAPDTKAIVDVYGPVIDSIVGLKEHSEEDGSARVQAMMRPSVLFLNPKTPGYAQILAELKALKGPPGAGKSAALAVIPGTDRILDVVPME